MQQLWFDHKKSILRKVLRNGFLYSQEKNDSFCSTNESFVAKMSFRNLILASAYFSGGHALCTMMTDDWTHNKVTIGRLTIEKWFIDGNTSIRPTLFSRCFKTMAARARQLYVGISETLNKSILFPIRIEEKYSIYIYISSQSKLYKCRRSGYT